MSNTPQPTGDTPTGSRPSKPFLDTPITRTENCSGKGVGDNDAESHYRRLSMEASKTVVGPMPAEEFLDAFLPGPDNDMPSSDNAFDATEDEHAWYESMMNGLNARNDRGIRRCPGFRFYFTGNRGSNRDLACYHDGDEVHATRRSSSGETTIGFLPGYLQMFGELRDTDFANDDGRVFLFGGIGRRKDLERAKEQVGQMVSHATAMLSRQHRNFAFSLFLTPKIARFLRWDRSGLVISEAFDHHLRPDILCRFLWRFGNTTDSVRGGDDSVKWTSPGEEDLFLSAITKHVEGQLGEATKEEIDRHYVPGRVVKIPVRTRPGSDELKYFLVSRPVAYPRLLVGRGTRGYWAVEVGTSIVVFLKDTWRSDAQGMELEGTILRKLNRKGTMNVPSLACHGDVDLGTNGRTQTDQFKGNSWNKASKHVSGQVHYCKVDKEAGYGLDQLAGTYELLHGIHCVYAAICHAFSECKLLHRDISYGNIILYADTDNPYGRRRGLLSDWETACACKATGVARDHWRSGTWAFMSIRVLRGGSRHSFADDVESLIHIVFYCGLLYLPWNYDAASFQYIINDYYNQHITLAGSVRGGMGKQVNLVSGRYYEIALFECQPLLDWITRSGDLLRSFYQNFHTSTYKAPTPKDVRDGFEGLFPPDCAAFLAELPQNDSHSNPWPYEGPSEDVFHATVVSSLNPLTNPNNSDDGENDDDSDDNDYEDEQPSGKRVKLWHSPAFRLM